LEHPEEENRGKWLTQIHLGPDSQTILGQTYDISYDNIL